MKFAVPEPNKLAAVVIRCSACRDSGFIQARHKENECVYAFRCVGCKRADWKGISARIPKWYPSLITKFEPIE